MCGSRRREEGYATALGQRTECKTGSVRRDSRRQRYRAEMGELALVRAVVIHHPDFLVPAAVADEINLALANAGNASTQAHDDFVGQFVCDQPGCILGGRVRVLLAQHLRGGCVLHVVEPALHRQFVGGCREIAECQHGRVGRRRVPGREVHVRGLARDLQRIKALRDEFDYAGVVEIVPQRVVEGLSRAALCASLPDALKSDTARRTFSTPRPVPVLIQSCANREGTHRPARSSRNAIPPRRRALSLALAFILFRETHPLHDNNVIRYVLLGKIL